VEYEEKIDNDKCDSLTYNRIASNGVWIVYRDKDHPNKLCARNLQNTSIMKIFRLAFDYAGSEIRNISFIKGNEFVVSTEEHHCIIDVGKGHFSKDCKLSVQEIIQAVTVHCKGDCHCSAVREAAQELQRNVDCKTGNGLLHVAALQNRGNQRVFDQQFAAELMQPNNRMETPLSIAFTNTSPKNAEILLKLCQKHKFKPHFGTRDLVFLMNDESLFMMALKSIELYQK
jgi:hypothetical protein